MESLQDSIGTLSQRFRYFGLNSAFLNKIFFFLEREEVSGIRKSDELESL